MSNSSCRENFKSTIPKFFFHWTHPPVCAGTNCKLRSNFHFRSEFYSVGQTKIFLDQLFIKVFKFISIPIRKLHIFIITQFIIKTDQRCLSNNACYTKNPFIGCTQPIISIRIGVTRSCPVSLSRIKITINCFCTAEIGICQLIPNRRIISNA